MLSRVADSLYWINRYVERAENISRFVEVSAAMALDCPPGSAEPWQPLIDASGHRSLFDALYPGGGEQQVLEFLIRAEANPNSIVNCIALARENGRQIRDVITSEMWEQLNGLYWTLVENDGFWEEPTPEHLREIRRGCQLFYGITDATLSRDLSWQFSRLGRLIERADKTTRILDVKYFLLLPSPDDVGGVLDELQWMSLLRSAGAYQMFRQSNVGVISPEAVASFLLLNPLFPRSVRYCLERIHETLQVIGRDAAAGTPNDLECMVGLTQARWSFSKIERLIAGGLHEAIDGLQQDLNQLHNLIHARYFVLPGGLSPEDTTVIPVSSTSLSTTASGQDLACAPA